MKKLILFLFVLINSASLSAQTISDIAGNWKFEAGVDDPSASAEKKATLNAMFASLTFNFSIDKRYTGSILGVSESGTWSLNGNRIEMYNGKATMTVTVVAYEKERLTLKMKNAVFTVVKKADTATAKNQFVKKWNLTGRRFERSDSINAIPKGNYIDLSADGNYTVAFGSNKENGIWDYNEANKALMLNTDGKAKYWAVVRVSATELVLIMGSNKEEFIFIAEK